MDVSSYAGLGNPLVNKRRSLDTIGAGRSFSDIDKGLIKDSYKKRKQGDGPVAQ
jgi:hypothetical protein